MSIQNPGQAYATAPQLLHRRSPQGRDMPDLLTELAGCPGAAGRAANEAARIEAECKTLNETILVSDTFAACLDRPWRSHGEFELRNIGRPIEILAPTG